MPNMSYCRFHNTRRDLSDCISVLNNEYDNNHISKAEQYEALKMLEEIAWFLLDNDLITEDYSFDEDGCKELLERHSKED